MRILIVDDSDIKIDKIKTVISESYIDCTILIAKNKADAMSLIRSNESIDLMILDLNLPNRNEEKPKRLAGLSLLKELNRRDSIIKPNHIIGLTAFAELQNEVVGEFIQSGWIIITYDNTKSDWEDIIKNKIDYINGNKTASLKNELKTITNDYALIMKGGGIKGLAYVGALEVLSDHFKFNWFAGTSAGAISAVLLSAGFDHKELKDVLYKKNFNDFKDTWFLKGFYNLFTKGGFYEAKTFTTWIERLLAKKLEQSTEVKLKSLPNRTSIYASSKGKSALVFDSNDIKINESGAGFAVRCSMSIPYVFVPQKNFGYTVFDGGIQNNYPVEALLKNNPDTKFLGLYLGVEHYQGNKNSSVFKELIRIWTESIDYEALEKYKNETIIIDTNPISTLRFNLSKQEKDFLVDCGKVYTWKYLVKLNLINKKDILLDSKIDSLEKTRHILIKKKRKRKAIRVIIILIIALTFTLSKVFDLI